MPFITASITINKVQNTVAGNTPPTSPTIGQMWNDTSATPPILKVWNGSEWVPVNMSIKQLDPVSFDEINRIINDTINDVNQSRDDINHALNQAQEAIEKAEFNNEKITAIEKTQSDDGKKIVELQANYNGVKQSVSDLETKQESDRIQLAGQISETVKNQEATNQRVSTAEHDILSLTTSDGKQNQRLDTAEESLKIISKKTDDNTEVINQTKQTADINSQKIVSTDGRVSNVEQTLTEQSQTIADNTGRINQAIQDIDSAERTISSVDGRVSKVEQNLSGFSSTVSNVQNQLNNKANQSDLDKTNQALNDKVNGISVGGTNLLPNTSPMPTMVSFPATKDSILSNDWQRFNENISGKEVLPKNIPGYSLKLDKGTKIVESLLVKTDGVLTGVKFTFYDNAHHYVDANIKEISNNGIDRVYQVWCQYMCVGTTFRAIDLGYIYYNHKSYIAFSNPKIEVGTIPTEWSPSPQDTNAAINNVDNKVNQNKNNIISVDNKVNQTNKDLQATNNNLNSTNNSLNGLLNTGTNIWLNSNFADGLNHWWKQNNNIQLSLVDEYLGTKVLDIKVPTNVGWVSAGTQERYPVTPGEKLSFSWLQNLISSGDKTNDYGNNCFGEIQMYKDTISGRTGTARLSPIDRTEGKWVQMKKEDWTVPSGCNYIGVNFCFSNSGEMKVTQLQMLHGSKVPPYQPAANDLNNAQTNINANKEEIKRQQTQINQTASDIDLIASTNGNPDAYFNMGTDGDINIGANHRLNLSANTYVTDGFTLSANNIEAGTIYGNPAGWINLPDTPKKFKENDGDMTRSVLNLRTGADSLDSPLIQEFYLSGMSPTPNVVDDGNKKSVISTSYSQNGLYFNNYDWLSNKTDNVEHVSAPAYIRGRYSFMNNECTAVEIGSGDALFVVEDAYSRTQLKNSKEKQYVQVGKFADGKPALSSPTIYTDLITSSGDEDNKGVLINDRLLVDEGIYSNWTASNNRTHINFPEAGSGDRIGLHTAEGDKNGSFLDVANGNWDTAGGSIKSQHHAFVIGGPGYTLAISNEEADNAQGNATGTLIASKFVTNSSRELKTDVQSIENIDQAVADILKIEPKQYMYHTQVEKIEEWKDNGKPADTFQNIDTEINVGIIAEELDEFDSLRPFIEKVSNEEGEEEILGIDYSKLTPLLLAVCQEQDNKINELEERLVRLELLMKDLRK